MNEKTPRADGDNNPLVADLRREMSDASEPSQCDRVAQKAGQALELGIIALMQALRGEDWEQASLTLIELDGVELILDEVRGRRSQLAPHAR